MERLCVFALPLCLKSARMRRPDITSIEASIVSDSRIAKVHRDFMDIPGATDVITFSYGEMVVSADTAAREGPEHGLTLEAELALYVIHGILHLHGWNDQSVDEAKEMHICQHSILKAALSCL